MDCTGVYDDNGNLTNVTISDEKKVEILSSDFTGSGTSTDPYQVNSSLGFWFMSKFVTLTNCYVELNCDVILNDETFDENGNASGGDGVVYSWDCANLKDIKSVNGNNFTINGTYFNNSESETIISIFKSVEQLTNLKVNNSFLNARDAYGVVITVKSFCENVITLSGVIKANKEASGVLFESKKVLNCENHFNVISGVKAAGFSMLGIEAYNCKNYGDILGRNFVGGFVSYVTGGDDCYLENCENFGNVANVGYYYAGGFVGICYYGTNPKCYFVNCTNYADVYGEKGHCGGIIGWCEGDIKLINTINYGNVSSSEGYLYITGALVGFVQCQYMNDLLTSLTIKNCKAYCNIHVIGSIACEKSNGLVNLDVSELSIVFKETMLTGGVLVGSFYKNIAERIKINIKNITISIEQTKYKTIFLTNYYDNVSIKNIFVTYTGSQKINFNISGESFLDGIIFKSTNFEDINFYYGSDFSGFYVAWRTGKIGLKALDGVGYFQGAIDEEWLENNGFVKK